MVVSMWRFLCIMVVVFIMMVSQHDGCSIIIVLNVAGLFHYDATVRSAVFPRCGSVPSVVFILMVFSMWLFTLHC